MEVGYKFLMDLAIILLSTKVLGIFTKKVHMPQVVGALLAGLFLGPAMLNVLNETEFITEMSEIGVIVLMFCAGMETDIDELKKSGKASFVIALIGVAVPLLGGFGVAYFFNRPDVIASDANGSIFLQNMFIGVILTATSVSITVETLKEMGKLKSASGNAILGAAIIDDILGIIALTIITSMADPSVHIVNVLLKVAAFFVFAVVVGLVFAMFFHYWADKTKAMHRHTIITFVFCLFLAYAAEEFFGVADITGAFIAGLIVSRTQKTQYMASKFDTLSYLFLSPIFFASIGLKVELPKMSASILLFAVALVIVAILTKVVGCGLGAKLCKYDKKECLQIGVGMISRGEVALIVASKGQSLGLIGSSFLGPVVIVVVITTIITPILLKIVFKDSAETSIESEGFAKNYEEVSKYR